MFVEVAGEKTSKNQQSQGYFYFTNRRKLSVELIFNQHRNYFFRFLWRAVTANIYNFPVYKTNFPFYETITNCLCYKTNSRFYKIKLRIMILTFHILKLSGYHNINIYILILIFHKTKLLL